MDSKFVGAALAGAVAMFLMGFVLYELLLGGFFEANGNPDLMRAQPAFLWIILGQIAGGFLLATILSWKGASSVGEGAKAGAVFGFLVSLGVGLTNYGAFDMMNLTATLVDPFVSALLFAVAGAVVGMMLGRGSPSPA